MQEDFGEEDLSATVDILQDMIIHVRRTAYENIHTIHTVLDGSVNAPKRAAIMQKNQQQNGKWKATVEIIVIRGIALTIALLVGAALAMCLYLVEDMKHQIAVHVPRAMEHVGVMEIAHG